MQVQPNQPIPMSRHLELTFSSFQPAAQIMITYLPLSHIAAQMLDMHMPMKTGCHIYFAQPDALKGSLGATLKDVRPTVFFGVPRVWEKIYGKPEGSVSLLE